ncbi:hypothetical protein PPTG_21138 [Phytophthora nicotianae INRA-310]|uniref:Uncharacterized protein n=1 Tax=Phytophthora nicotianae (strain INRA-310) TaxID=761204 RepID=W2RB88_PHYN3|nr:hypothetical protein PPTG_21138 [Phytophthora nicotianae INRA-310]ETN21775.1 hypothetical protein PPTG_21138 [Phytophthora nicotianae INRA-310]
MRDKTDEYFEADHVDALVATPTLASAPDHESVLKTLQDKIQEAQDAGLPIPCVETLQKLLACYCNEGARPVKVKARRYPPLNRQYLDSHVQELLDHGLAYVNHRSRWMGLGAPDCSEEEPG